MREPERSDNRTERSDDRTDRPRARRWHRPANTTLATAAAVLACAIIGVLLGAYLHEVQRPHATRQATLHENVAPPSSPSPSATTLVVTVAPRQATTGPSKTHRAPQHHTGAPHRPTGTTAPTNSSPSPTPSTAPSSSRPGSTTSPPSTGKTTCGGLLGCLLDPPGPGR